MYYILELVDNKFKVIGRTDKKDLSNTRYIYATEEEFGKIDKKFIIKTTKIM